MAIFLIKKRKMEEIKDSYLAQLYQWKDLGKTPLATQVLNNITISQAKQVANELSNENLINKVSNVVSITDKGIAFCEKSSFQNPRISIVQMMKEIEEDKQTDTSKFNSSDLL